MFTLLSEESVSQAPQKAALYTSITFHVCALLALTWISLRSVPTVRFELMPVPAGAPEPVREPQYFRIPIRTFVETHPDHTKLVERAITPAPEYPTKEIEGAGYTP